MPINMNCPSCNKTLSAPDTAAGKKAKCPSCGQVMIVPEVVHEAEEFGAPAPAPAPPPSTPFSPQPMAESTHNWLDEMQNPAVAATTPGPGGEARRPCPECGEMIMSELQNAASAMRFSILALKANRQRKRRMRP